MSHTPGPWDRNIKPASKYPIIFAGRNTHVAQVITRGIPDDQAEGNADLIAAAPDMLAALDAFVQWHADHFEDFTPHDNAQLLCLANDASAAIALARNT